MSITSSTGRSLDASIQRVMEDRMGESFSDVQVHTGSTATAACESINARAFTVGNHVAFNAGEYDPSSAEGQHVIAHELAHVRQQTGGGVSTLPQEGLELEVDPDPALEREAEATAQQVMEDGPVVINRMGTEMHIQRSVKGDGMLYDAVDDLQEQVDGLENRQSQIMETMLEATPGASEDIDWAGAATKGATGFAAGTATGSVLGPEAAAVTGTSGALVGMASAVASDITKETIGTLMNQRPEGEAEKIESMYLELAEMFEEFKAAQESTDEGERPSSVPSSMEN